MFCFRVILQNTKFYIFPNIRMLIEKKHITNINKLEINRMNINMSSCMTLCKYVITAMAISVCCININFLFLLDAIYIFRSRRKNFVKGKKWFINRMPSSISCCSSDLSLLLLLTTSCTNFLLPPTFLPLQHFQIHSQKSIYSKQICCLIIICTG